jgi:ribosomal protein S18 acetylase RimI-like enzyme
VVGKYAPGEFPSESAAGRVALIRRAVRSDDDELAEIDRLTWSPAITPQVRDATDRPFFVHGLDPADVLVAEVDGVVSGYVAVGPATRLTSGRHVLAIFGLAVSPAQQRRGIARHLMMAAIEAAQARGARRLTLHVLATNHAARRLYERLGFVTEGVLREEFLIEGRYVDDVLMALAL